MISTFPYLVREGFDVENARHCKEQAILGLIRLMTDEQLNELFKFKVLEPNNYRHFRAISCELKKITLKTNRNE